VTAAAAVCYVHSHNNSCWLPSQKHK